MARKLFIVSSFVIISASLVVFSTAFINWTSYGFSTGFGDSMIPTFHPGTLIFTNPLETPEIGDIVSFKCLSKEKCDRSGDIVHRLVSVDPDGCMHIYGDNASMNWDPKWCLYPDEISISGVVHKL